MEQQRLKIYNGKIITPMGIISGGTALALTTAMGEAHIATLTAIFEADPDAEITPERVGEAFKKQLKGSPLKL